MIEILFWAVVCAVVGFVVGGGANLVWIDMLDEIMHARTALREDRADEIEWWKTIVTAVLGTMITAIIGGLTIAAIAALHCVLSFGSTGDALWLDVNALVSVISAFIGARVIRKHSEEGTQPFIDVLSRIQELCQSKNTN